jgi:hypothetical protein
MGPVGEVDRIMGLVNASQQVVVQDPTVVNDVTMDVGGQMADVVSRHAWFRLNASTPEVLHMVKCPGGLWSGTEWIPMLADGQPAPRPQDFIPGLYDSVSRRIPTPIPRVAPADELPDGWAFVQIDTYFWIDQAPGQWETVSATASVPSLSVTVQAAPERLVVNPGDGGGPVLCEGAQPAIHNDTYVEGTPGCTYVYRNSSSMAANGATFPLQVAIEWHVTWSASNGEGSDLGMLRSDSVVRDLPVAEIQAVLTG